jgi:hypothetical protein
LNHIGQRDINLINLFRTWIKWMNEKQGISLFLVMQQNIAKLKGTCSFCVVKLEIQFRDLMNVSQWYECRTTLSVLLGFMWRVFFLLLPFTCNISSSVQCKTLIYLNNQTDMWEWLFQFEMRLRQEFSLLDRLFSVQSQFRTLVTFPQCITLCYLFFLTSEPISMTIF